jgi:hypothetical protein
LRTHGEPCTGTPFLPLLSTARCARSRSNHVHKIEDCPERVRDASDHCGRATNRDVGLDEIVMGVAERDGSFEVFQFLTERQSEAGESLAMRPDG